MTSEDSRTYFQFLANMGLTKHIGSMQATRELLDLCHIGREAGQARTRQGREVVERYGCRGFLRVLRNFFVMILTDRASRAFLGDVMTTIPKDIMKDMGYGIYVGRKGSA